MPATYTHGVYGQMVLRRLPASWQTRIQAHRTCYDTGLSGPDILFFYRPLWKNPVKALGYGMHQEPARRFFEEARERIRQSEHPWAAWAYILGFLNHFVLDSQCHPLINRQEKELGVSHSHLESELDAVLMREQGLDPSRTPTADHIGTSRETARVIAPFFSISPRQAREALWTMKVLLPLFVAPGPGKRALVSGGLGLAGLRESLGGLMIRRQPDPVCQPVCRVLRQRMEEAVPVSCRLIREYTESLLTRAPLDSRFDRTYE